jgi:hypothetical protein
MTGSMRHAGKEEKAQGDSARAGYGPRGGGSKRPEKIGAAEGPFLAILLALLL